MTAPLGLIASIMAASYVRLQDTGCVNQGGGRALPLRLRGKPASLSKTVTPPALLSNEETANARRAGVPSSGGKAQAQAQAGARAPVQAGSCRWTEGRKDGQGKGRRKKKGRGKSEQMNSWDSQE